MADDGDDAKKQIQPRKVNAVIPGLGVAVGVVPFMANGRTTEETSLRTTPDGVVIEHVVHKAKFDRIGVPCGGVAIVLGMVGLARGFSARRYQVLALGLAAMALGVLQVVRGFMH